MLLLFTLLVTALLLLYLLASADDVLLDLAYLVRRGRINRTHLKSGDLARDRPLRLAVMIGAWQEAGVVSPMIASTVRMMHYPASRVDFFIGVYPNDSVTLDEVQRLCRDVPNVHCVVNERPGPTSKSQNLNGVYAAIEAHEREHGDFDIIAVHDAEDVIHPYTFALYSALLKAHEMVQIPVFALFPKVRWNAPRTWLQAIVSGSYADEFAEHHLHHLPARESLGLFIPSAGTGFAMRRDVMRGLHAEGNFLTEGALTEDYELALRLWRRGIRVHFHIQPLPRVNHKGQMRREYVAVKEHFPTEIPAAIKQKGRWTYGITLQTPGLIKDLKVTHLDRLTLWHDQKGKYTNLIHLVGYPLGLLVLLAGPLGWSWHTTPLIRELAWVVLGLTVWRVALRAVAVRRLYGLRQALLMVLLLPGLPLRWLVGNYINTFATLRAWRLYLFPEKGQKRGTARWDKTERKSYVSADILNDTRRKLGDQLLLTGQVDAPELARLLRSQRRAAAHAPLGEWAVENKLLTDTAVRRALARTHGTPFIPLTPEMIDTTHVSREDAQALRCAVLGTRGEQLLIATPEFDDRSAVDDLRQTLHDLTGLHLIVYATSDESMRHAYRRPGLRGSHYQRVLRDQSIPADMLEFELLKVTQEYNETVSGKMSRIRPAKKSA